MILYEMELLTEFASLNKSVFGSDVTRKFTCDEALKNSKILRKDFLMKLVVGQYMNICFFTFP